MKINPAMNPNVLRSYQATAPSVGKNKAIERRDEVTLSEDALNFSKALAEARDAIESRSAEERAHIADITNAVRQGTYKVDSDLVAAKIIEAIG